MKRREFLKSSLFGLPTLISASNTDISESNLKKLQNIDLRKKDFVFIYRISTAMDFLPIGTFSIKYHHNTNVLDLGLDEYTVITSLLMPILGEEAQQLEDFVQRRYFTSINEVAWHDYKERFGLNGEVRKDSTYYLNNNQGVVIFKPREDSLTKEKIKSFRSEEIIHNPLEIFYRMLCGELVQNFNLVANKVYIKNVNTIIKKIGDINTLEVEFKTPVISEFYKFEAKIINNIPYEGSAHQRKFPKEIIGKLENIIANGKSLFE